MTSVFTIQSADGVIAKRDNGEILIAAGTSVPADGVSGYAVGCIFLHVDGGADTAAYVNEGTSSSADFNALGVTNVASLPLAGGTMDDAANIAFGGTTGTKLGTSATAQKLGFFNATPVVQPTNAAQAAVVTTAATQTTPYGYATQAQADAIVTLVNRLRLDLVNLGLIKGS